MRILVAGGGGVLGRKLIQECLKRHHDVSAFAYRAEEFAGMTDPRLTTFACDITQAATVQGVCEGVDAVVSCVGITRQTGALTHEAVDHQGNVNLLREAERAGVRLFAFISPAGVDEGHDQVPLLQAKYRFETALKQGRVPWLIFRAGGFYSDLAEMGKYAAKGSMFLVGSGRNRFTPVDVSDLAAVMAEELGGAANRMVSVGGPADMSWDEIGEACFRHHGRPPRLIHVPVWLCTFTLALLRPFSKKYDAMGRLILFMSTTDLLTEKRGRTSFAEFLGAR